MHLQPLIPILLATLAHSTHLLIRIPPSTVLPNPSLLPPSTTASLTTLSTLLKTPLRSDNTFDFRNVSTGSYLLDIHCATHSFAPLRVDVHDGLKRDAAGGLDLATVQVWGTFRGNEWGNKGEVVAVAGVEGRKEGEEVWGFDVQVRSAKEYFVERSGFSPLSLLKNPMILIAGVSMAVVFGMPYLMDNMDPELRAEFEARQKKAPLTGGQPANPLQNFDAAAWLAGSSTKKSDAAPETEEKGISR